MLCQVHFHILNLNDIWGEKQTQLLHKNVVLLFLSLITFYFRFKPNFHRKTPNVFTFDVFITSAVAHTKHTNVNPNAQDLISRPVPSRFITASLRTRLKYSAKSTHTSRKRKTQNARVESKDIICN